MRYLITTILLALAPLSWGYTFDDGTEFKDPLSTYKFLSCTRKNTVTQINFALSIKGRHVYIDAQKNWFTTPYGRINERTGKKDTD